MSGQLHAWFEDYLSGRRQRVVVDGVASSWTHVTSGMPQGSILGPVLFAIFINDLPNVLPNDTSAALNADDTKVFKSIKSEADCKILQHALTNLECWSSDNNLDFNQSKCKVLTITRKKSPLVYAYRMNSKELLRVNKGKDLSICITTDFHWDAHIQTITVKANKMLGLLKRTCPLEKQISTTNAVSPLSDLNYVTVAKSGLHTLQNTGLKSKASKDVPLRGYYNPSMAK